ncbi:MAG: hypothetical protein WCG98_07350 [bacterium]
MASTSRKGLSSWTDVIKRNKDNSGWERKSLSPETVDKNKVKKALEIAINTSMKEGEGPEITLSEDMWKSLNKKEQTNLKELREKATFQTMPTDKFGLESYAYTLFVNPQLESRIINEPNPRRDAAFLYRAME